MPASGSALPALSGYLVVRLQEGLEKKSRACTHGDLREIQTEPLPVLQAASLISKTNARISQFSNRYEKHSTFPVAIYLCDRVQQVRTQFDLDLEL